MNKLIDEIVSQLMTREVQDYQIDILTSYLAGKPFNLKDPMKMIFKDESSAEIDIPTLRHWVGIYKSSPTHCISKEDYEKKLFAMRI